MEKLSKFWRLTVVLDAITYLILAPLGFVGIFVTAELFSDGHRLIFGFVSLILAIILNSIIGVIFRKRFIYDDLEALDQQELTKEEKVEIKINLLCYPLREGLVMIPRWILGFPSILAFASLFMPITLQQMAWTVLMGIVVSVLGFFSNYLNAENALNDIFRETGLKQIPVDEEYYLDFGLTTKLTGIIIAFVITAGFAYSYLAYILNTGMLNSDNYLIYYLVLSALLAYTFISFTMIFISSVKKSLNQVENAIEEISKGNLTARGVRVTSDEIGNINEHLNVMAANLKNLVKNIDNTSDKVFDKSVRLSSAADENFSSIAEVNKTIDELARGASEQAESTSISLEGLNDLGVKIEQVQSEADLVQENTLQNKELSEETVEIMEELEENFATTVRINEEIEHEFGELNKNSEQIGAIVSTINAIANQTNLLALNATIEAARAGEAGRGFSVVAEEIRQLAHETEESTEQIAGVINNIQNNIQHSNGKVEESKEVINITQSSLDQTKRSNQINMESVQKSLESLNLLIDGIIQVNKDKDYLIDLVSEVSSVSQETAAGTEEISASMAEQTRTIQEISRMTELLQGVSDVLTKELNDFRVS